MIINLIGGPSDGATLTGIGGDVQAVVFIVDDWDSHYVRTGKTIGDIALFEFEEDNDDGE